MNRKTQLAIILCLIACCFFSGCFSLFEDSLKDEGHQPTLLPVLPDLVEVTTTAPALTGASEPVVTSEETKATTALEVLPITKLASFERLDEAVLHYLKQNKIPEDKVGLAYVPVTKEGLKGYFYNGEKGFEPASTIKVFVALEYAEKIISGELAWDDEVEYDPEKHFEPGAGPFQDTLSAGDEVKLNELVWEMLRTSDNVALRMLQDYYHEEFDRWPLDNQINKYQLPYRTENRILSPEDLIQGVSTIYRGAKESEDYAFLLQAMEQSIYGEYFNALFPEILSAHKTGNLNGCYADCGIIYDTKPYYFSIMTEGLDDPFTVIQELGSLVQQYHRQQE